MGSDKIIDLYERQSKIIIYYLMKFKMSKSIVWLYIKMKG